MVFYSDPASDVTKVLFFYSDPAPAPWRVRDPEVSEVNDVIPKYSHKSMVFYSDPASEVTKVLFFIVIPPLKSQKYCFLQ